MCPAARSTRVRAERGERPVQSTQIKTFFFFGGGDDREERRGESGRERGEVGFSNLIYFH